MVHENKVKQSLPSHNQRQRIKVLVFGHKEFSQLFGTMTTEYSQVAEFHIVDAIVGSIVEVNKYIDQIIPDVVISAGSNAAYLQNNIKIPVIALPVTDADIIVAISKASKACSKIKLITYDPHHNLVPLLEKALSISIEHHTYATAKLAREQFYLLSTDQDTAIVGASLVCDLAAQNGIKSFMYYSAQSCRDAIEQAISKAKLYINQNLQGAIYDWVLAQDSVSFVHVDIGRGEVIPSRGAALHFDLSEAVSEEFKLACFRFVDQVSLTQDIDTVTDKYFDFQGRRVAADIRRGYSLNAYIVSFEPDAQYATANVTIEPQRSIKSLNLLSYRSEAMASVLKKVNYFGLSPSNVLITGESGTGKELIARSIHAASQYAEGAFVALNCSAIPTELFEGELFGHVQGAYTGARKGGRKGLIHEAQKGVLFLDEVSELSFEQQAKLLRFIQERCYRQVGGNQEIHSDVKIVAATNKPLIDLIEKGSFRHDLFYRLNVLNISIPPLRHRCEDITCIAERKLAQLFTQNAINLDAVNTIAEINVLLSQYPWPGNVRELENILERLCAALLMAEGSASIEALLIDVAPELKLQPSTESDSLIAAKELELVAHAMDMFNGDKQRVADYLGMSQTTLWRRLKKLNQQHKNHSLGDTHAEL